MISDRLIQYGMQLAQDIAARAVLVFADVAGPLRELNTASASLSIPMIVAVRLGEIEPSAFANIRFISVPDFPRTRLGQIKVGLLISLSRGILRSGDRVVVLTGIERSRSIDTVMVLDLDKESELVSAWEMGFADEGIKPEVFERVLSLCTEIAIEGREGRQIGTIFVVGDSQTVLENSKNLILNPFYGYLEVQRNIMDLALEETVKEFATIDGAFIISGEGTIETAGARILASKVGDKFPKGLGTRHAAAAAITAITNSVAFAISQSTGNISIFKAGILIAEVGQSSMSQRASNVQFTHSSQLT